MTDINNDHMRNKKDKKYNLDITTLIIKKSWLIVDIIIFILSEDKLF